MVCGLLGEKLSHSYSPQIHTLLGQYSYALFEKAPEALESFLRSDSFHGLNVTIPYKKSAAALCDELTPLAKELGSVNTIVKRPDGTLIGHNTDYFGFSYLLEYSKLRVANKKVLVLGSGGSGVTAVSVLENAGANVVVISRTGENNYKNLNLHTDAAVIVNTTPVGMFPQNGVSPVDLDLFPNLEGVLDIIYNPARTKLLLDAEKRGLVALNGLRMLVAQAKESAEWFTNTKIDNCVIESIHRILKHQMENIVLIGMPGCGKSTIGQKLSEALGRKFTDADNYVEELAGKSIPDIFAESGEDIFRTFETAALKELGKQSSLLISTGGGCVTRSENYDFLHQNSTILWVQRDLDLLPTDGRPLSQQNALAELYQIRRPMYESFADNIIQNDSDISTVIQEIILKLNVEAN
jgi:shikimate dehydrogenase